MTRRVGDLSPEPSNAPVGASGFARLVVGHTLVHASMSGMRLAAPLLALHLGLGTLYVGVLLALYSLTQVFIALPAGRFVERHGLRRPLGLGALAAGTGAWLCAAFPRFEVLCLAALLMGGATGLCMIALQRYVGRAARDGTELKRMFSWLSLGPAASNFVGPVLAGLCIDHFAQLLPGGDELAGFRAAFACLALLPLTGWLLVRSAASAQTRHPPVNGDNAQPLASAWELLRAPRMRALLLVNWLLSSCWDVHTFVVPVLGHERQLSASVIGGILGGFAVAALLVRLLIPLVAAQAREWHVTTAAMLSTALLFAIYPLMHSAWAMAICSVFLGFALGSVQPMIMSTLHHITPEPQRSQALALRLMAINFSSVLMPLLFGSVGAVLGVSVLFWSVGSAVGLGSRAAWRLRI